MINLLSPDQKSLLRAARRNSVWLRYTILIIAAFIAINAIFGTAAWYIAGQEAVYKKSLVENESNRNGDYKATKELAQKFRKNLSVAKIILSGETNYSSIIFDIAHTIPSGCILDTLSLNNQSLGTPQSLSFQCKQQSDSLRLKTALQTNSTLFQKVNIVTTQTKKEVDNTYGINVTMSVILQKPVPKNKDNS